MRFLPAFNGFNLEWKNRPSDFLPKQLDVAPNELSIDQVWA